MGSNHEIGYRLVLVRGHWASNTYRVRLYAASRFKGNALMPPAPFDKLIEQFRDTQGKYSDTAPFVWLKLADEVDREKHAVLGHASLWRDETHVLVRYAVVVAHSELDEAAFRELRLLAETAARHLPAAVLEAIEPFTPIEDFARWMVVVWLYRHTEPKPLGVGWLCGEPFWDSVCALNRCEHLNQTAPPFSESDGEWRLMSAREVVKTLFPHERKPRGRQLPDDFRQKYTVPHSAKLLRVRVDTMPDDLRAKFIKPPRK